MIHSAIIIRYNIMLDRISNIMNKHHYILFFFLVMTPFITSCGVKGPLYLPTKQEKVTQTELSSQDEPQFIQQENGQLNE